MSTPELFGVVVLTLALLTAIASKVRSRAAFRLFEGSLAAWGLTQKQHRRLVAISVTVAEIAAAVTLIAAPGRWRFVPVFTLILGLTVAYTITIARRGGDVPCHCFGATDSSPPAVHFVSNVLLLAAAAAGWLFADAPRASMAGGVLATGFGLIIATAVITAGVVASALTEETHR